MSLVARGPYVVPTGRVGRGPNFPMAAPLVIFQGAFCVGRKSIWEKEQPHFFA